MVIAFSVTGTLTRRRSYASTYEPAWSILLQDRELQDLLARSRDAHKVESYIMQGNRS
jgi:hypothetical protein